MYFRLRSYRCLLEDCSVTYNAGPFQDQGIVWSCTGWGLSGDLPMSPGKTLSLTITLPNEQRIELPEPVVKWFRGQEFAVETVSITEHTKARLQDSVKRLVLDSPSMNSSLV